MAKSDGYSNVMDPQVEGAKQYDALCTKHRADAKTPEGKRKVESCLKWLTYCGECYSAGVEVPLEGYHKWLGSKGTVQRTGKTAAAAG